jgi:hypothetical protein
MTSVRGHAGLIGGRVDSCQAQQVANIWWAFGTLRAQPPPGVQVALSRRMLTLLPTCTPQNLCNTLWAHAKVHCRRYLIPALPCCRRLGPFKHRADT